MSKDQRRMERFIVIPFSSNCRSESSVDVIDSRQAKKPQGDGEGAAGCGRPKGESLVERLLKGFKNLSQIFAVYEDEEEEEEEREMVIGLPTDVKHVAHIGWDGSTSTTNSVRSWNRAAPPPPPPSSASSSTAAPTPQQQQQAPLTSFSMRQFELAMAAQAAAGVGTAIAASTSTASTTARQYRHS